MEKENDRGNWKNWFEFMFSTMGCMVGLGNIWRFPYLCYKNGGGAFLIPYFFFLFVIGMPMVFMELSYSQFANLGPGRVWIICPLFKGIGYGMTVLTAIIGVYYNVIIAWTLYYLVMSFSKVLPWSTCGNEWNTDMCYIRGAGTGNLTNVTGNMDNATEIQMNMPQYKNQSSSLVNISSFAANITNFLDRKSSSEEFWDRHVLNRTDGIHTIGNVRWQLLLCFGFAWICVILCLIKGIKSSGKVMYVAASLPFLFLTILLIRGLLLPGAVDGIRYYVIPRWEKLLQLSVWGDAASQIVYSIGIGIGGLATLASYNNFNNNCYRDAMIFPVLNSLTSFYAGLVIFVILGFMAHESNVSIDDVVAQGPGVAFMAYPEALSKLPLPQLWSVMFFIMLFFVGLDSQIVHVQTIVGALTDRFPHSLGQKQLILTIAVCSIGFLLGLPCITQGGVYILQILDWYVASVAVLLLCFLECFAIAWVYGAGRLLDDIAMMIGYRPCNLWKYSWMLVQPVLCLVTWLFGLVNCSPVKYGDKVYPGWAIGFGWIVALLSIVPVPVVIVMELYREKGTFLQRLRRATRPSAEWAPADKALIQRAVGAEQLLSRV